MCPQVFKLEVNHGPHHHAIAHCLTWGLLVGILTQHANDNLRSRRKNDELLAVEAKNAQWPPRYLTV